jgi:acetylornithine deacetylase
VIEERMERYREVKTPVCFLRVSFSTSVPVSESELGKRMNVYELTRALVDIESITNHEASVGEYLFAHLSQLAAQTGGRAERCPVEPGRFNVFAQWGQPIVTLSTHMDTVPPFFPSREDADYIWGRGSADAKGIIAAMVTAVQSLLASGARNFGLLFVVGEERNSAGAYAAANDSRGSRYLINGEPTENKLAVATKGVLRYEIIAQGKLAHSAYPELGDSAIVKLLDALERIRRAELPADPVLGRTTVNIGVISGGRAPNVVPDEALAELSIRIVGDPDPVRQAIAQAAGNQVEAREVLITPAVHFDPLDGFETKIVSFTTDIPSFEGAWGKPFLLGPGNIHLAHTSEERVPKRELNEAVQIYQRMVHQLLAMDRRAATTVAQP